MRALCEWLVAGAMVLGALGVGDARAGGMEWDDPRWTTWVDAYVDGDVAETLRLVEADLVSPDPHPSAAYVWLSIHVRLDDLDAAAAALADTARARVDSQLWVLERIGAARCGEVVAQLRDDLADDLGDPWLPGRRMWAARNCEAFDLAVEIAVEGLLAFPDQFELATDIAHIARARQSAADRLETELALGGRLADAPTAPFLRAVVPLPEDHALDDLRAADAWLAEHPDDPAALRFRVQHGLEPLKLEGWEDASVDAVRAFPFAPLDAPAALAHAERWAESDRWAEWVARTTEPLDADSKVLARAHYTRRVDAAIGGGWRERARSLIADGLDTWPEDDGLLERLATLEKRAGRWDERRDLLELLDERGAAWVEALRRTDDVHRAARHCRELSSDSVPDLALVIQCAMALRSAEDSGGALALLDGAEAAYPSSPGIEAQRALTLAELGRAQEALPAVRARHAELPGNSWAVHFLVEHVEDPDAVLWALAEDTPYRESVWQALAERAPQPDDVWAEARRRHPDWGEPLNHLPGEGLEPGKVEASVWRSLTDAATVLRQLVWVHREAPDKGRVALDRWVALQGGHTPSTRADAAMLGDQSAAALLWWEVHVADPGASRPVAWLVSNAPERSGRAVARYVARAPYSAARLGDAVQWHCRWGGSPVVGLEYARRFASLTGKAHEAESSCIGALGGEGRAWDAYKSGWGIAPSRRFLAWFMSAAEGAHRPFAEVSPGGEPFSVRIQKPDGSVRYERHHPELGRPVWVEEDGHGVEYFWDVDSGRLQSLRTTTGLEYRFIYDGDLLVGFEDGTTSLRVEYTTSGDEAVPSAIAVAGVGEVHIAYDAHGAITEVDGDPGVSVEINEIFQRIVSLGQSDQTPLPELLGEVVDTVGVARRSVGEARVSGDLRRLAVSRHQLVDSLLVGGSDRSARQAEARRVLETEAEEAFVDLVGEAPEAPLWGRPPPRSEMVDPEGERLAPGSTSELRGQIAPDEVVEHTLVVGAGTVLQMTGEGAGVFAQIDKRRSCLLGECDLRFVARGAEIVLSLGHPGGEGVVDYHLTLRALDRATLAEWPDDQGGLDAGTRVYHLEVDAEEAVAVGAPPASVMGLEIWGPTGRGGTSLGSASVWLDPRAAGDAVIELTPAPGAMPGQSTSARGADAATRGPWTRRRSSVPAERDVALVGEASSLVSLDAAVLVARQRAARRSTHTVTVTAPINVRAVLTGPGGSRREVGEGRHVHARVDVDRGGRYALELHPSGARWWSDPVPPEAQVAWHIAPTLDFDERRALAVERLTDALRRQVDLEQTMWTDGMSSDAAARWEDWRERLRPLSSEPAIGEFLASAELDALLGLYDPRWLAGDALLQPRLWRRHGAAELRTGTDRRVELTSVGWASGEIVVGTEVGLLAREGAGWRLLGFDIASGRLTDVRAVKGSAGLADIRAVASTADGALWLGTADGLVRVEAVDGVGERWSTVMDGLGSRSIRALATLGDSVFVGTDDGAARFGADGAVRGWPAFHGQRIHAVWPGEDSALIGGDGGLWRWSAEGAERLLDHPVDSVAVHPETGELLVVVDGTLRAVERDHDGSSSLLPVPGARPLADNRVHALVAMRGHEGRPALGVLTERGLGVVQDGHLEFDDLAGLEVGSSSLRVGASRGRDLALLRERDLLVYRPGRAEVEDGGVTDLLWVPEHGGTWVIRDWRTVAFLDDNSAHPIDVSDGRVLARTAAGEVLVAREWSVGELYADGRVESRFDIPRPETRHVYADGGVVDMQAASDGSVWGVTDTTVFRFVNGELETWSSLDASFPCPTEYLAKLVQMPDATVRVVASQEGHLLYEGRPLTGGVCEWTGTGWVQVPTSGSDWLVTSVTEVANDLTLLGTNHGPWRVDGEGARREADISESWRRVAIEQPMSVLMTEGVEVAAGVWLFGSAGGLLVYEEERGWRRTYGLHELLPAAAEDPAATFIHAVEVDGVGRLLIGTYRGLLVYDLDGEHAAWSREDAGGVSAPATGPVTEAPVEDALRGGRIEVALPGGSRGLVDDAEVQLVEGIVPASDLLERVIVDGVEARLLDGGRFEASVELEEGENRITVFALYSDARRTVLTEVVEVTRQSTERAALEQGKRYAVLFGVQDYDNSAHRDLATPWADIDAMARVLREEYGFRTALPGDESDALVVRDPSRRVIMQTLNRLVRAVGPNDRILVYYAGHSAIPEGLDEAYWLPRDAGRDPVDWISGHEVANTLRRMRARSVLVVSDSCYSAALTTREAGGLPESVDLARGAFLQRMSVDASRLLIASGNVEPVADGGGDGHSVFARALLDRLRHPARDAFTSRELFVTVQEQVVGHSRQSPQHMVVHGSGHEGGDFVFVRQPSEE